MAMKEYVVDVWDDYVSRARRYKVTSSSEDDARQLAFALDGGWGEDYDAREMLPLVLMHTSIVR